MRNAWTILKMMYLLLVLLQVFVHTSFSLEKRITVNVEPSKEDCFFQHLEANDNLQIEYQVIGGGHGDLDISFNLVEPVGRIVVADFKKPEKSHNIHIDTSGDYRFCFDNTFSSFNTKTVYFEIITYNSAINEQWPIQNNDLHFDNTESQLELQQFEGLHDVINTVRNNLNKARTLQDMIKLTEAKDRNIAEETFFKVNACSLFILTLLLLVSFIQILMVKSIFDEKSKLYKLMCFLDYGRQ